MSGSIEGAQRLRCEVRTRVCDVPKVCALDSEHRCIEPTLSRPPVVTKLLADIEAADGLVFCAPEFNPSIPGVLKNAIDWASRPAFASVLAYKPVAIMATSRGPLGGARCLEHMKVALDSCLSRVALAREVIITAAETRIKDGRLVDETCLGFVTGAIDALLHEIALWKK